MYDVAIIGAGLAGLAAASRLSGYKVALLERERRVGGRVLSRQCDGVAYDLGALFASSLPLADDAGRILPVSRDAVLLCAGRSVWRGTSPLACLRNYALDSLRNEHELSVFLSGKKGYESMSPPLAEAVAAFFGLIHPAPIHGSLPERQRDGLKGHAPAFRREGNGAVIDELMTRSHADHFLDMDVVTLRDRHAWVDIMAGDGRICRARNVIMATPPAATARLLRGKTRLFPFLEQARFYPGLSMVFSISKREVADFSYLVTLDGSFNSAVKCERDDKVFIHVYCLGARYSSAMIQKREKLLVDVAEHLYEFGAIDSPGALSFVDAVSWDGIGPHIASPPYQHGVFDSSQIGDRLFVAGDYTWFDAKEKMPYGMQSAVLSGRRAAEEVMFRLSHGSTKASFS